MNRKACDHVIDLGTLMYVVLSWVSLQLCIVHIYADIVILGAGFAMALGQL